MRAPLAFETYQASRALACDGFNVHVERNGEFYSVVVLVEQADGTFLKKRGIDPNGALYKMFQGVRATSGTRSGWSGSIPWISNSAD